MNHNLGKVKGTTGALGLMFAKSIDKPYYIPLPWFEKSIHTMFMRFSIDILFIDKLHIVVDKVTLAPWKNYTPKNKKAAIGAIEYYEGKFKDINIGDFVKFEKI
jgi:uncharacterized membrane protein (UPF0127 family)